VASYTRGEVLLEQLRYIIGEAAFDKGMLLYFNTWKFKHPNTNDFFRVMEKASGLELDWFKEYFVHTTHTIDYALEEMSGKTLILRRIGNMPMPLDVTVKTKNGQVLNFYIPLEMMRGEKKGDRFFSDFKVMKDWPWTNPTYMLDIGVSINDIDEVKIDTSGRLADTNKTNDVFPRVTVIEPPTK
jgi:hypothetical protein